MTREDPRAASERPRHAAVLAVGDELLTGVHPDLDTPLVAAALLDLGIEVRCSAVERDDVDAIEARLRDLCARHHLVVTTGGLGPTDDDVTRDAIARVLGAPLEERAEAWAPIEARFAARGREAPRSNRRQALLPRGAEMLPNALGTAPGFWAELPSGAVIVALPGPPSECAGMVHAELLPRVRARLLAAQPWARAAFSLVGLSESSFADMLGDWMARDVEPRMGVSARDGVLVVKLSASGVAATERLAARCIEFRARFAAHIYAEADLGLEAVVVGLLAERGLRVAFAESCTGGLLSERVTRVPGASAVFQGAVVSYANAAKVANLGVDPAVLEADGAVSEPVALAMARGARRAMDADLALSITGVAGPDGGTPDKPVGHVWFGLASGAGERAFCARFPAAGRQRVRVQAVQFALELLRREVLGLGFAGLAWSYPSAAAAQAPNGPSGRGSAVLGLGGGSDT